MLKDKVAVVTGAARGIGREIAIRMAQYGAKVVVNDYGGSADALAPRALPAAPAPSEPRGTISERHAACGARMP